MRNVKYTYTCDRCECSISGYNTDTLTITSPRNKKISHDLCKQCVITIISDMSNSGIEPFFRD